MKERWFPRLATNADMGRTKRWVPLRMDMAYLASLEDLRPDETEIREYSEYCAECGRSDGFEMQAGNRGVLICAACGAEDTRVEAEV